MNPLKILLKVQRINNQNQNNEINEESYTMKNATIATQILKEAKELEEKKRNEKELNDFIKKNNNNNINKDAEKKDKEE